MRPVLERLPDPTAASWSMLHRALPDGIPFQWHHHPEMELTLTLNSRGQRFIGDHVGRYDDGDLALIGPNLPHTWASSEIIDPAAPHLALVFWFRREWLESLAAGAVEFAGIAALLGRSNGGLLFSDAAAGAVRSMIHKVFDLAAGDRLLALLAILARLAEDADATALARPAVPVAEGRERIDRVLRHVHQAYDGDVSIDTLADIAALSPSGLHRLFRRHTGTTVSDYLMRLRIGDAAARLSGGEQSIQAVATAAGYRSLANFNRQFRRLRGMTPRDYRRRFRPKPRP